jgi:hypothetical protein
VPEQLGIPGGETIKYITFSVVFFSILLCSVFILLVEKYPRISIFLQFFFKAKVKSKRVVKNATEDSLPTNSNTVAEKAEETEME